MCTKKEKEMKKEPFKLKGFNQSERKKSLPMLEKISKGLGIEEGCGCDDDDND